MAPNLVLALDLGTSNIKAGFFDDAGGCLGSASIEYELNHPRPNWVECDIETYWRAVREAVRSSGWSQLSGRAAVLAAISISSQGETLLCLDDKLQPLRPAMVWLDNRATVEAEELGSRLGLEEIYAHTGQVESVATWTACKILWLRRHEPNVYKATRRYVLLEDWLIHRLTGELVGEHSLYPTSLYFDIRTRSWWSEMLDMLGITASQLTDLVEPGTIAGRLEPSVADELGLPASIPVVAGGLDQILATTAGGNVRPGVVTELTGTILALAASVSELPPRHHMLPIYLHVVPGLYCALPYGQTGGLVMRWLRDNCFGAPGDHRARPSYDEVIEEALAIEPGAGGVLVLPHLDGAYFPEFDLSFRGAIVGLALGHTRGHITRAALESIGYMLRNCIEGVRGAGIPVVEMTSLGPAATNQGWTQLKADICGLPVHRLTTSEASLLGAAILGMVAIGRYTSIEEATTAMSAQAGAIRPSVEFKDLYDQRFEEYRDLHARLRPYFRSLT